MRAPRLGHNTGPQRDSCCVSILFLSQEFGGVGSVWNRLLGSVGASAAGAPVVGQQDLIVGIQVHGNRRIPADTVKARIFSKVGDVYDTAAIERDFNALWNTGYFEDIRFEREQSAKGWILHIYLKERPTIREINYTGLNAVSTSDVLDRFKERKVGLSVENQYDPTKIKKAEVVLKELLAEHGRQFATIRTEVRPIPPAAVGITFVIKEGPKVKVGRIRFRGNKHISDRTLRAAMKNLKPIGIPHSIFLENIFAKTYDATKLEEDTERVRAEFQNRGYFKVLVDEPKTEIHDTGHTGFHIPLLQPGLGKSVDITMPIEEGERYRLGTITFKNNKAIPNSAALRSLFPMKDGEIFSREKVAKGLENLRKAYGEAGYINFTSVPDTKFDDEKKIVNLTIDVDEGKQFYVRRIEFQGNTTTRDKVIRREIALEEGQIYNSRYWELSLLRLNQLGYFDQLKPDDPNTTERHLDEKAGTVDLTLKVKEKGKNSIGLQGGVSGLAGAFVGINYSTNNFLGLGETLSVQASLGSRQRDVVFGFTEPYLFDRPIQAGFNVYLRKINYDQAQAVCHSNGPESEPARRLPAEPAELLAVQHRLQPELKLPAAPFLQAPRHQLLLRPLFAGRGQQRFQAAVRESQLQRHHRPQRAQRHRHQQDHSQLHHEHARCRLRAASWQEPVHRRGVRGHRRHGSHHPSHRPVQTVFPRSETPQCCRLQRAGFVYHRL